MYNARWIKSVIDDMAQIGRTSDGGVSRAGFSWEDSEGAAYFISLMQYLGFHVKVDSFGNIFARLDSGDNSLPAVACGSHIDTVPNGGHYDGILGVASSIAAVMQLKNEGIVLNNPIEIIIFRMEESSRFGCATMGSKVISGKYKAGMWDDFKDKNGVFLSDAMASLGFRLGDASFAAKAPGYYKSFIELHLDQGSDLYNADCPIGIAESIAAPIRASVLIQGEAGHSGTTGMKTRKDALVSAAEFILSVRNFAMAYADKGITATVGNIDVYPGAINVVPGCAELCVDLRGTNKEVMDEVYGLIRSETSKIAFRRGTPIQITFLSREVPVRMDMHVYSLIKSSCSSLGINCKNFISGSGHDAMNMASITPSGMIFVRGGAGGGHRSDETASEEDIALGLSVLKETLRRLAQ